MAVRRRATKGQFDLVLSEVAPEAVGSLICQSLAVKGFCVVNPGFDEGVLEKATSEAGDMEFYQVNAAIADGLLGAEGSSSIADLESHLPEEERIEGDSLKAMDHTMTRMGYLLEPYIDRIGFDMTHRSRAVLNRSGEAEEETPPLNEIEVSKWQQQFIRHRLMVIIFLGPKLGNLELEPFNTDDAQPYQVKTVPGTMVILRPDTLAHKHSAPGASYALSSFYMTGPVGKRAPDGGWKLTPAAKQIEDWMFRRLKTLKEMEDFGNATWDPEIPDGWRKAMNHTYKKGQTSGIAGIGLHFIGTYDIDDFFKSTTVGVDLASEVPIVRWNHDDVYDPDPESWKRGKANCRHGGFMDGTELFDNKFFNLSPNEARQLDPHQRLILEQGYNALADMGFKKKNLMNAAGGVYIGCGTDEWAFHTGRQGPGGVTGQLCMYSGRFSFCLGLKGPAITLTTEAASGLSATYIGAESVMKKGLAVSNDFAISIGVHILLAPMWWSSHCMNGWYSPEGRCMSFNSSANGYVRGDGCGAVGFKPATHVVDSKVVANEKDEFIGTVAGAMMNTNGKVASLTTPHGPGQQEAVVQAIKNAGISPLEVEMVQGSFNGKFLDDAIEVNTMWRAHRSDINKDPICMGAIKTQSLNQVECSGITAFLTNIYAANYGKMSPNLHLRQNNPHVDPFEQPIMFTNECLTTPYRSVYSGTMSIGFGGTNVFVVGWASMDNLKAPPSAAPRETQVVFWPGGGGQLEGDTLPRRRDFYTIVGSWSKWEIPEKMENEGEGIYGFTVTLGENRYEQFQIWLDGEGNRALHPGGSKMPAGSAVLGPDEEAEGGTEVCRSGMANTWMIDGRDNLVTYGRKDEAVKALTDGGKTESIMVGGTEAGVPGTQYRVTLEVSGRFRMVTWEKLPSTSSEIPASTYYVTGSSNNWDLDEMTETAEPGIYTYEVKLQVSFVDFLIVRDKDWGQLFYPNPDGTDEEKVLGPDDLGGDFSWRIVGKPGDKFKIQFQRILDDSKDKSLISWQHIGHEPTTMAQRLMS